jgi:hypothetical protein
MARNEPSYGPIARAREMADRSRLHLGQMLVSTLMTRQEGRGSPQWAQRGGVKGRIRDQHPEHTGPRVGSSSGVSQAAQTGASRTESRPSAKVRSM